MKAKDYLCEESVLFGAFVCQTRKDYLKMSSKLFADLIAEKGVFSLAFSIYCLRDMVKGHRPVPTHVGAEKIVKELAAYLAIPMVAS